MKLQKQHEVDAGLLESIKSFPLQREVIHCGKSFFVSPFDFYAECPLCGARMKVRSLSAVAEIEDVFDAVLEWLDRPEARALAKQRQKEIEQDKDDAE